MTPDRRTVADARRDPVAFARHLIGEPLWDHQQAVVRSTARIRAMVSGRQAGKSRLLAVEALHTAFSRPGSLVMLVSAGEAASKDLLAHTSMLAQAPWLGSSVLDESQSCLTLSNGSEIRSVPPSVRRVRGPSVDLLIMDEACWIDQAVWTAARFSIIARPGSRVIACSTPYGRQDHWFAVTYRAGLPTTAVEDHESFHWPSTASPLVDRELLDLWRRTSTEREYRAEVEADWVEDAGSYFSAAELEGSTTIDPVPDPLAAGGRYAIAGVDWGFAHDASALALLEPDGDGYRVPYVEEAFNTPYATFVDRVTAIGDAWRGLGFKFSRVYSETNGVGAGPSQLLQARLTERQCGVNVTPVATTAKSKEDTFGALKLLMQQGRLALPRFPPLLRQLAALEFATTETGTVRISVPERSGHDDLAMALCIAATGMAERVARPAPDPYYRPQRAMAYVDAGTVTGGAVSWWD